MLAPSLPMMTPEETVVVGARAVCIIYECPAVLPTPHPQLAPGLSPYPLREVGAVGDGVPFCSTAPKPRAAMQRYDLRGLLRRDRHAPQAKVDSGLRPGGRPCDQYPCEPDVAPCCVECSPDGEHESKVEQLNKEPGENAATAAELMENILLPRIPSITCGILMEPETAEDVECGEGDDQTKLDEKDTIATTETTGEKSNSKERCFLSTVLDSLAQPVKSPNSSSTEHCLYSNGGNSDDVNSYHSFERLQHVTEINGESEDPQMHSQGSINTSRAQRRSSDRPLIADFSPNTQDADVSPATVASNKQLTDTRHESLGLRTMPIVSYVTAVPEVDFDEKRRLTERQQKSSWPQLHLKNPSPTSSEDTIISPLSSRPPASRSSQSSLRLSTSPDVVRTQTTVTATPKLMRTSSSLKQMSTLLLSPVWMPRTTCYVSLANGSEVVNSHYAKTQKRRRTSSLSDDDIDGKLSGALSELASRKPPASMEPLAAPSRLALEQPPGQKVPSGRNLRCEALRWARGEPLHAHCAFVAFPNDTQRSLRPWPDNRLTRSIFTGAERYVAPQNTWEAMTPKELLARAARADAVRQDVRDQATRARAIADAALTRPVLPDYEVSNPSEYDFRRFRPTTTSSTSDTPAGPVQKRDDGLLALIPLMPRHLINVRLAPPQINFGTVGAGSCVSTRLVVENDNEVPVKVNVHSPERCLTVLGDGVIYVPAHGTADLSISLYSHDVGRYNGMLRYVLNDSHAFEASVTADVVVPYLILRTKILRFGFVRGCEDPWPQLVHVITVENPLQVASYFEWTALEKTCYEVVPRFGDVPPNGAFACEVTYRTNPDAQNPDAELLLTNNENYLTLSCRLTVPTSMKTLNAGFVNPSVDLPPLSLLRRRSFVMRLYNASFLEVLFKAVDGREGITTGVKKEDAGCVAWRLRPTHGIIPPRSVRLLILSLRALKPGSLTLELRVALGQDALAPPTAQVSSIPHGQAHKVWRKIASKTITTKVACPNVVVKPTQVRLARVQIGGLASAALTFQNVGAVEATVRMVETDEVSRDDWALSLKADRLERPDEPLMLPPRSPPVELFLLFRPMDIASYEFLLPLQLNSGIGPPRINDPASVCQDTYFPESKVGSAKMSNPKLPCVLVDATVSRQLLSFSATKFHFSYDGGNPEDSIITHILQIENVSRDQVLIWLPAMLPNCYFFDLKTLKQDNTSQADSLRNIPLKTTMTSLQSYPIDLHAAESLETESWLEYQDASSAVLNALSSAMSRVNVQSSSEDEADDHIFICLLAPSCTCSFQINFIPDVPGSYSAILPVFLGNGKEDAPLMELILDGVYYLPTLKASTDQIILPPRPLNVPVESKMWLEASHHERDAVISWHWEEDYSEAGRTVPMDCIEVVMVERCVPYGSALRRLCATVVFKSTRSLGLRARIIFSTGPPPDGASCTVMVTAIADCSLLTTHAFLRSHTAFRPAKRPSASLTSPQLSLISRGRTTRGLSSLRLRSATICSEDEDDADDECDDWPDFNKGHPPSMGSSLSALWAKVASITPLKDLASPPVVQTSATSTPTLLTMPGEAGTGNIRLSSRPLRTSYVSGQVTVATGSTSEAVSIVGMETTTAVPPDQLSQSQKSMEWLPRRHRGQSRCASSEALVDADEDSLVTSESSIDCVFESQTVETHIPSRSTINSEKSSDGHMENSSEGFPYFPDIKDDKALYMRRLQIAVQEWLYDVVYRRYYWATLPDGLNQMHRLAAKSGGKSSGTASKKNSKDDSCPFDARTPYIAFLNLSGKTASDWMQERNPEAGQDFRQKCNIASLLDEVPQQATGSTLFATDKKTVLWKMSLLMIREMAEMLYTMRRHGAVLPHVRPEYLIDYCGYRVLFHNKKLHKKTDNDSCRSIVISVANAAQRQESDMELKNGADGEEQEKEQAEENQHLYLNENNLDLHGPLLSKRQHRRINRQAWLDVALQWARSYWLPKIDDEHANNKKSVSTMRTLPGQSMLSTKKDGFHMNRYNLASAARYSDAELSLLAWLNERFSRVRLTLCPGAGAPPPRFVTTFDQDLADGVVLAAATLDVCPFLREYLPDLHPAPADINQAHHNAARLVSAWNAARLGFTVCVHDIVYPLAVKMLLLVAHLYNVLPGISASHTLRLSSSLATHASESLALVNPSKFHMQYLAEFIGDRESFFSLIGGLVTYAAVDEKGVQRTGVAISLGPEEQLTLRLRYHARTFKDKSCTLLLTGLFEAPNFGRSLALRLEGHTSSYDVIKTINVTAPLYQPTQKVLSLPLPYSSRFFDRKEAPTYEFLIQETMPAVGGPFLGRSWKQLCKRKVLHRLFINENFVQPSLPKKRKHSRVKKYSFQLPVKTKKQSQVDKSTLSLSVTLCAFTQKKRSFWIGCVCPHVGDFICKVVTHPTKRQTLGTLDLPLPPKWRLAKCTCDGKFSYDTDDTVCPLVTHVQVPCRNSQLWKAAISMFGMTLDETERAFWREHIDSSIGPQLMQYELEKDDPDFLDEYAHLFNTSVDYKVSLLNSTFLSAPRKFSISDVCSDETVSLPIHVDNDANDKFVAQLHLTSEDEREVRKYFIRPADTRPSKLRSKLRSKSPRLLSNTENKTSNIPHFTGSRVSSSIFRKQNKTGEILKPSIASRYDNSFLF